MKLSRTFMISMGIINVVWASIVLHMTLVGLLDPLFGSILSISCYALALYCFDKAIWVLR